MFIYVDSPQSSPIFKFENAALKLEPWPASFAKMANILNILGRILWQFSLASECERPSGGQVTRLISSRLGTLSVA